MREQVERLKENYRLNYPNDPLPPDSWMELTQEERDRATCAPPWWKCGVLPPEERKHYFDG